MSRSHPSKALGNALSDCRTCKRRRIVCDRTLPKCCKCGTRSLECPGYGSQWRWVEGVARSVHKYPPPPNAAIQYGLHVQPVLFGAAERTNDEISPWKSISTAFGMKDGTSQQLLHHYTYVVAPQMVWVDSAENPFVTVIIPRALQSPALMMSILSFAAGDLWTRKHDSKKGSTRSTPSWQPYHHQALNHLAQYLKDENNQVAITPKHDKDRASPGLAAFLLASLGLKLGSSTTWRLHTRAAWTMTEHWNFFQTSPQSPFDGVRAFLLSEVYANEVWCSVTNFRPLASVWDITSALHGVPFTQYIDLIRSVSDYERCRTDGHSGMNPVPSLLAIRSAFHEACERTRTYQSSFTFRSPYGHAGFESVVYMLNHAGILYACQVFQEDEDAEGVVKDSRQRLFAHLQQLVITESFAQDLTWPLFIAGTHCNDSRQEQQFIERRFNTIMELSGVLERPRVLQFLQELWHLQTQEARIDWIYLARVWAEAGKPILVV